jgi:hypothetical protein
MFTPKRDVFQVYVYTFLLHKSLYLYFRIMSIKQKKNQNAMYNVIISLLLEKKSIQNSVDVVVFLIIRY